MARRDPKDGPTESQEAAARLYIDLYAPIHTLTISMMTVKIARFLQQSAYIHA
ncbi:MAG: hypothetical protein ACR2HF_11935 [Methylococcaceae bacterium]